MSSINPSPTRSVSVQEDPGRTLGIVGLVLAIFGSVIGLIISAVAYRQSKEAGFTNGVAKAGIVVGVVTTVLSVIWVIAAAALAAHSGGLPQ